MSRELRFGPQPGERVRVRRVSAGYPLGDGLKDGDVVLLKSFAGGWYGAEFQGRDVRVFMAQIVQPMMLTNAQLLCPDCHAPLTRLRELLVCPGCAFRCRRARPASVLGE